MQDIQEFLQKYDPWFTIDDELSNLQEMLLHKKQITTLPDPIGKLSNLQDLYLHDNEISELPYLFVN